MPAYSWPRFSLLSVHKPALLFITPAAVLCRFPHLYHDDDLALFEANSNSGGSRVLGCFVRGDYFQQLHFVNRGEVVHPDHLGRRKRSGLRTVKTDFGSQSNLPGKSSAQLQREAGQHGLQDPPPQHTSPSATHSSASPSDGRALPLPFSPGLSPGHSTRPTALVSVRI